MIKAYSIAYDTEKIKPLDVEVREQELEERARKLFSAKSVIPAPKVEGEFVEGLFAENLGDLEPLEEAAPPVLTEQDIEEIKNSLRQEIMAEMTPILNRRGEDIVANARAQANGLIEAGKRDAEIAKEGILKMASAQGYEEGLQRAKEEENRALSALEARRQALEQEYQAKIAELEPAFANILVELVKKVTNVAYDNHKEVLLYLIETGLGFAQKDTCFDVMLNEEDYKKYASLFPKIKEHYKEKYTLEFKKSADLPEGSCKLENENRVIDCGLGVRLGGLLDDLSLLG
jgi:flagellar assembly protein FliH